MRKAIFGVVALVAAIVGSMTFGGGSQAHTPANDEAWHSSDDGWWQTCKSTGAASYDPIVAPGVLTGPHRHLFFGGRVRPDTTTTKTLRASNASHCHWGQVRFGDYRFDVSNQTGYWIPDLWADNEDADSSPQWIGAIEMHAYYKLGMRDARDANNQDVLRQAAHDMQAFPEDFKMIAREDASEKADSGWYCSGRPENGGGADNMGQFDTIGGLMNAHNGACGADDVVTVDITFPQCGQRDPTTGLIRTDSGNHRSHVAYPTANGCPGTYPIVFPEVKYTIKFRARSINTGPRIAFSNGAGSGEDCTDTNDRCFHADYLMGWDTSALNRVINMSTKEGLNRGTNTALCNTGGLLYNGTDFTGRPIPNCRPEEPYYPLRPNENSDPPPPA